MVENMNPRPLSVTLIACLYLATGAIGLVRHVTEFRTEHLFPYDTLLISLVSLIALVCGIYLLRGQNWARWLTLAWIGYHVILSAFHSLGQPAIHCLFCAVLTYFLTRPDVNRYFRRA